MFDQIAFGESLKNYRKEKNYTQEDIASQIGVSAQAVSKWEKGECLPDLYNIKLLARLYRISIDTLLDVENEGTEKVIETYRIENAVFELVEKPAAIYAGKMTDETTGFSGGMENFDSVVGKVLPERDIHISINFWNNGQTKKIFFAREVTTGNQPDGIEVYKMPAGLFLRAYTDKNTAVILGKDTCDPWEFFAVMWNFVMKKYKLKVAKNANGEDNQIEIYDSVDGSHGNSWAYAAVERK